MARPGKGRDATFRSKSSKRGDEPHPRHVYIFTEGEVTEPSYINIVMEHGTPIDPDQLVMHHNSNITAESKHRKPLTLFDRDNHPQIPEAFRLAESADVRVACSHPCFETLRPLSPPILCA